ncbi:MAG: flagellar filament capping protein FliD [Miltoncostaeaceae bacterium]
MSTGAGSPITFSGLGSGIDTNAIVEALMQLERQPINRIEQDKNELETKQSVVQEINGLLGALKTASTKLFDLDTLLQKNATSSNDTAVSASASANAVVGSYDIDVTKLAKAHTVASVASPTLIAGQQLDITVGGTTKSVAIQAGDDLQAVADRINGTDDIGTAAGVINDRLVLISKTGGAAGAITAGGTAAATFGFTTTQNGEDAEVKVNGLTVTSSTNEITGAIPGVTLTALGTGTSTITVAEDDVAIDSGVQEFVDAFNSLISNINATTSYDAESGDRGALQGDQTITAIKFQARSIIGNVVGGLAGTQYDSLAQIGITSNRDGTLTLDSTVLKDAIADDADAVRDVFGFDDASGTIDGTDGIARQLSEFADTFSNDILSARLTGITSSLSRMDDRIASLEDLMLVKEDRLRRQFSAMEVAITQFQGQSADLASRLGSLG